MDIKGIISNRFTGALGARKSDENEPVIIDRAAVGKFLNDLPKNSNGMQALPLQDDVIILLPQADIDKIVSPKTPANTELILRALVGNEPVLEAGLRAITVGELLPYLANEQIQQSAKQSNLDPDQVQANYINMQIRAASGNTVRQLNREDIRDVLPPQIQGQLFPIEEWKEISAGTSPKIIPPQPEIIPTKTEILDVVVIPSEVSLGTDSATTENIAPSTSIEGRRTRRRSSADNNVEA
ncbi:MAG: hypothetical protein EBR67_03525 [Proteobacteria bacterium]|nr:hypothetical protein [Pseudomonadota bacterium]